MLVIRFFRVGKKNQPSFKIVVTDKRKPPRKGRFIEEVGFYNPLTKEKILKGDRIMYWLSVGAKPSATVYNLLVTQTLAKGGDEAKSSSTSEKIIEGKKIDVHKKAKEKEEKETPAEEKPVEEKKVEEKEVREKPKKEKPVEEKPAEEKSTEVLKKEKEISVQEPPKEPAPAKASMGEEKKEETPEKEEKKDYNPPSASSHSPEGEQAPEPPKTE